MTAAPATSWDRFWFAPTPLLRLAWFRIVVAWGCLYDAFLYRPAGILEHGAATGGASWNPILVFELLHLQPPSLEVARVLSFAYAATCLLVLVGWRTRMTCLLLLLLAFWQGGLFYSLTKVHHDRVALFFATLVLPFAPCGARLSVDAALARRRGAPAPPDSPWACWPLRLVQCTICIGYGAAGLAKLTAWGWTNGYTLQGIAIGHRGAFAHLLTHSVLLAQALAIVTVVAEVGAPLALLSGRLAFLFIGTMTLFHFGTWATMDTGPYMTLWFFNAVFVPIDRIPAWVREAWRSRRAALLVAVTFATVVLAVAAFVLASVVPLPWLAAAAAATAVAVGAERVVAGPRHPAAPAAPTHTGERSLPAGARG